jgi:hypothetical protein
MKTLLMSHAGNSSSVSASQSQGAVRPFLSAARPAAAIIAALSVQ